MSLQEQRKREATIERELRAQREAQRRRAEEHHLEQQQQVQCCNLGPCFHVAPELYVLQQHSSIISWLLQETRGPS